jgi:hypothetical protein
MADKAVDEKSRHDPLPRLFLSGWDYLVGWCFLMA